MVLPAFSLPSSCFMIGMGVSFFPVPFLESVYRQTKRTPAVLGLNQQVRQFDSGAEHAWLTNQTNAVRSSEKGNPQEGCLNNGVPSFQQLYTLIGFGRELAYCNWCGPSMALANQASGGRFASVWRIESTQVATIGVLLINFCPRVNLKPFTGESDHSSQTEFLDFWTILVVDAKLGCFFLATSIGSETLLPEFF